MYISRVPSDVVTDGPRTHQGDQAHVIISFEFLRQAQPSPSHPQVISFSFLLSHLGMDSILSVAHSVHRTQHLCYRHDSAGHMMVQVLAHRRVSQGRVRVEVPSPRSTVTERSGTEFTQRLLVLTTVKMSHIHNVCCTNAPPPPPPHTHTFRAVSHAMRLRSLPCVYRTLIPPVRTDHFTHTAAQQRLQAP
jgi:hypothetical protein